MKSKRVSGVMFRPYITHRIDGRPFVVLGDQTFELSKILGAEVENLGLIGMNIQHIPSKNLRQPNKISSFLKKSSELGWTVDQFGNWASSFNSKQCISIIDSAVLGWKLGLRSPSLEKILSNSVAAKASYLLEIAWFVSRSTSYLTAAVNSSSGKLKCLFELWEREERDHHIYLCRDLKIDPQILSKHDPAHASINLVAYLFWLATTDPVSFAVSMTLLEADPLKLAATNNFISDLESELAMPLPGFKKHFFDDLGVGHSERWKTLLQSKNRLTREHLSKILTDLHSTRHILIQWMNSLCFRLEGSIKIGRLIKRPEPKNFVRFRIHPEAFLR